MEEKKVTTNKIIFDLLHHEAKTYGRVYLLSVMNTVLHEHPEWSKQISEEFVQFQVSTASTFATPCEGLIVDGKLVADVVPKPTDTKWMSQPTVSYQFTFMEKTSGSRQHILILIGYSANTDQLNAKVIPAANSDGLYGEPDSDESLARVILSMTGSFVRQLTDDVVKSKDEATTTTIHNAMKCAFADVFNGIVDSLTKDKSITRCELDEMAGVDEFFLMKEFDVKEYAIVDERQDDGKVIPNVLDKVSMVGYDDEGTPSYVIELKRWGTPVWYTIYNNGNDLEIGGPNEIIDPFLQKAQSVVWPLIQAIAEKGSQIKTMPIKDEFAYKGSPNPSSPKRYMPHTPDRKES